MSLPVVKVIVPELQKLIEQTSWWYNWSKLLVEQGDKTHEQGSWYLLFLIEEALEEAE